MKRKPYGPKDLLVAARLEIKRVWLVIKKACAKLIKTLKG